MLSFNGIEMASMIFGMVVCLISSGVLIRLFGKTTDVGIDYQRGPQKIHQGTIPRVGGLAIIFSTVLVALTFEGVLFQLSFFIILSSLPAFLAGFAEDITNSISPSVRLIFSIVSGFLFWGLTGYCITDVNVEAVKFILQVPALSVCLTVLALATLVNAMNVIDGLNGLAGGTSVISLLAFAFLAHSAGDIVVLNICLGFVAVIIGFLVWNLPFGKIFLGDGGAYFLGILVAGIAVIVPERNSELSPFASLLIVSFPFYELVRSTFRRLASADRKTFEPDDRHFHSVMFKFVSRRMNLSQTAQNSCSAMVVLMLPLCTAIWAVSFYDNRSSLAIGAVLFVLIYEIAFALLLKAERKN